MLIHDRAATIDDVIEGVIGAGTHPPTIGVVGGRDGQRRSIGPVPRAPGPVATGAPGGIERGTIDAAIQCRRGGRGCLDRRRSRATGSGLWQTARAGEVLGDEQAIGLRHAYAGHRHPRAQLLGMSNDRRDVPWIAALPDIIQRRCQSPPVPVQSVTSQTAQFCPEQRLRLGGRKGRQRWGGLPVCRRDWPEQGTKHGKTYGPPRLLRPPTPRHAQRPPDPVRAPVQITMEPQPVRV